MNTTFKTQIILAILTATLAGRICQAADPTMLQISVRPNTAYARLSASESWDALLPRLLSGRLTAGQIIAVNGEPAAGVWSATVTQLPPPRSGHGAPAVTGSILSWSFAVTQANGARVGEFTASATHADMDGDPSAATLPLPITNGSGAYFGVQGTVSGPLMQRGRVQMQIPEHVAHVITFTAEVLPVSRPVVISANAQDGTAVSANNPLQAGQVVSLYATNISPDLDNSPAENLNELPLQVKVANSSADIVSIAACPDTPGQYQIAIRVPENLSPGPADVLILSGFMPGPWITLPVR